MSTEGAITKLSISTCQDDEEKLAANDYQMVNVNFSTNDDNRMFLWFKKECGMTPITRIQFSFSSAMESGLYDAGYEKIDKNLNISPSVSQIFMWFFYGKTESDIPIVNIEVSKDAPEEPDFLLNGWERLGCDLRRSTGGKPVYLWVKREKPSFIHEISATTDFDSDKHKFDLGFTRVDENTNRGAGGKKVFLWYRRTVEKTKALTALNVSIKFQEDVRYQNEGFKKLTVNLNEGSGGNNVYAWHTNKGCDSQMQSIVILASEAWNVYEKAGVNVIEKNLNEGNKGHKMYLAYK